MIRNKCTMRRDESKENLEEEKRRKERRVFIVLKMYCEMVLRYGLITGYRF